MNQRTVNFNGVTVNPLHVSRNPAIASKGMFVSRTSGIFSISTVSSVIREAARIGSAAFFCAPDFNLADQRISAIDCILFHISSYFCCTGSLSIASISSFSA